MYVQLRARSVDFVTYRDRNLDIRFSEGYSLQRNALSAESLHLDLSEITRIYSARLGLCARMICIPIYQ